MNIMYKRILFSIAILLVAQPLLFAQTKLLTGKIVGEDYAPLPGVTVQLKNTKTIKVEDRLYATGIGSASRI